MTPRRLLISVLLAVAALTASACTETARRDTVKWYDRVQQLDGITVMSSRRGYSRHDNPAVELMRRVIAAKRRTRMSAHDYYCYNRYRKLTMAVNDVDNAKMSAGVFSRLPGAFRQVEFCPYNNRLIMPLTVSETFTQQVYRRHPHAERTIVRGERSDGIDRIFRSGELITAALKDFFADVDIYDDHIPLLQRRFVSPIADGAIGFYRFFIVDTVAVDTDRCIRVRFVPENRQDPGFSGDIYIMDDRSLQVRRCELSVPRRNGVNFIDGLRVFQEFGRAADGRWVLTSDDMMAELSLFDFMDKCIVIRNTRMDGHYFGPLPDELFSGPDREQTETGADRRDDAYWMLHRRMDLTPGERNLPAFVSSMKRAMGSNIAVALAKLAVENYIEAGPVDIGPITSMVSSNYVDGLRTRIGVQTTAKLSPHLFAGGWYARGWNSRADYYKAELTYSLNRKKYLPHERPMRNISLSSAYDLRSPSATFMLTDKDNMFTALRWTDDDKLMAFSRQQLRVVREETWGLRTTLSLTAEESRPRGNMRLVTTAGDDITSMRTTELRAELRYSPGENMVSIRRGRYRVNDDSPVLTLSHSLGTDGFLGGQYAYNYTEATLRQRLWMGSWGKADIHVRARAQWNRVPFPLLCIPAANLSYIRQDGMFSLMRSMELISDRSVMADVSWDLGGKLFNRIPLVRRLKWREYIGVKALWGCLTDKNNPAAARNAADDALMRLPEGCHALQGDRPYVEIAAGVHNVFRFFHIEYVRRLTYLDLPTATRQGVRFGFKLQF